MSYAAVDKMGRLTGIPASVGALMLARGEAATPGAFAPEDILDPGLFFAELDWRHPLRLLRRG